MTAAEECTGGYVSAVADHRRVLAVQLTLGLTYTGHMSLVVVLKYSHYLRSEVPRPPLLSVYCQN